MQRKSLDDYPDIFTLRMIAEYMDIGYTKALNLLKSGKVPCIHIGNAYKVSKKSFSQWLEKPGLRKVL